MPVYIAGSAHTTDGTDRACCIRVEDISFVSPDDEDSRDYCMVTHRVIGPVRFRVNYDRMLAILDAYRCDLNG